MIYSYNWIIIAVGKQVLVPVGFIERCAKNIRRVSIDEPTPSGIVIPAVEVVQPRFRVVDVAPIAERVKSAESGGERPACVPRLAPRVIGVGHYLCACAVHQSGHIALRIPEVEIVRPVVVHGHGTDSVVGDGVPPANPAFCVLKAGLAAYSSPRVEISCPSTSRKELFDLLQ